MVSLNNGPAVAAEFIRGIGYLMFFNNRVSASLSALTKRILLLPAAQGVRL